MLGIGGAATWRLIGPDRIRASDWLGPPDPEAKYAGGARPPSNTTCGHSPEEWPELRIPRPRELASAHSSPNWRGIPTPRKGPSVRSNRRFWCDRLLRSVIAA